MIFSITKYIYKYNNEYIVVDSDNEITYRKQL